jgi:hypothetical protein
MLLRFLDHGSVGGHEGGEDVVVELAEDCIVRFRHDLNILMKQ